jgi:hypothetical protein
MQMDFVYVPSRATGLADSAVSQVFRSKACMLGDPRQHFRAYFFTIMECKDVVRPTGTDKNPMRSAMVPFDDPTDAKQGGEDLISFC